MDAGLAAFLGALIGAGLGAWATLTVQRRDASREDRYRYSSQHKQLFEAYLAEAREWARLVRKQVETAWEWSEGHVPQEEIPTLPESLALTAALERLQDSVPKRTVAYGRASLLRMAIEDLEHFVYRAGHPPADPGGAAWRDAWTRYELDRAKLRDAYQREVGVVTPGSVKRRHFPWQRGRD